MSSRGFTITKTMREERRKRAEKMHEEYNQKYPTIQDKLNALPATGATKQRARLEAALKAEHDKKDAEKLAHEAKAEAKAEKSKNKKGQTNENS